ncbi:MAG: PQQ-binding-like beta-propeller repeat protein [Acidimicrobiia bacterium]
MDRPSAIVVDTDMGADDVMALLFLLEHPAVDVRAITVSGTGLVHCDPGVNHVRRLLAVVGAGHIPVACGRETPLQGDRAFPDAWRADADRLYGVSLPDASGKTSGLTAPELLLSVLESSAEDVTVLTLGPLTNISELLTTSPDIVDEIDLVYTMGGALDVPGNVAGSGAGFDDNPAAEWNFFIDPRAARTLLESGALVTLVALDATNDVPFTPEFAGLLAEARSTPASGVVADLVQQNGALFESGFFMWDPLTAAVLADETLAVFEMHTVAVVDGGGADAGSIVASLDGGVRTRVAVAALRDRFEKLLLDTLAPDAATVVGDDVDATGETDVYGEAVWEFSFGGEYHDEAGGLHSSPAIADGVVYFGGSNGTAYALDLETGDEIWAFPATDEAAITDFIALSDEAVFFKVTTNPDDPPLLLLAVDRHTGAELWRFQPPGEEVRVRNPTFADGVVYTGTNEFFYALDADTGDVLWRFRPEGGAPGPAGPATVVDGVVYFGTPAALLYAVDINSHEELWPFPTGPTATGVASRPTVDDGVVYFGSDDAIFYAVDASDGSEVWRFEAPGPLPSSPAIGDGRVLFGALLVDDGGLIALDQGTGDELWRSTSGSILSSPTVVDGAAYVGSFDGNLYVVDVASGEQLWRFRTESQIANSPVVVDGVVYFMSGLTFYAVRAPS